MRTVITNLRYIEIRKAFDEAFDDEMSDAEIIVYLVDVLSEMDKENKRLKGRKL